jgi:hypothetical protein
MKFASMIAFGVAPHAIGKGHPEGIIGGVHSNYYFNYPPANRWPLNTTFIKKSLGRWKEYPNLPSGGYLYIDVNLQPCSQKHSPRLSKMAGTAARSSLSAIRKIFQNEAVMKTMRS